LPPQSICLMYIVSVYKMQKEKKKKQDKENRTSGVDNEPWKQNKWCRK